MKQRKLKSFVKPTLYLLTLCLFAITVALVSKALLKSEEEEFNPPYELSITVFEENYDEKQEEPIEEEPTKPSKPFIGENVNVQKDYYDESATSEEQENSLIYYENTYMPNTGILYASDNVFEISAVMAGKVKEIKQDEILGTLLTLEISDKVTVTYYTLGEVLVKQGDTVNQNDVIAKSGQSKIDTTKQTLLFEVYLNGKLTNPNIFFEKNIEELK